MKLTAIYEKATEGGFICWVEEIPEAMSQGDTMDEAKTNLMDALNLVLEYRREEAENYLAKNKNNATKESISLAAVS